MSAVPNVGDGRDSSFENVGRGTFVGSPADGGKYTFRASVTMCREEQFLRAYWKGYTEAEFNISNPGTACFTFYLLFVQRVASRGSYQNEDSSWDGHSLCPMWAPDLVSRGDDD